MKLKGKLTLLSKRKNTALFATKKGSFWITKAMVDFPEILEKEITLDLPSWLVKKG